jgi:signal transduction histidine kinase
MFDNPIVMAFLIVAVLMAVSSTILVVAACMLSSWRSQTEEQERGEYEG